MVMVRADTAAARIGNGQGGYRGGQSGNGQGGYRGGQSGNGQGGYRGGQNGSRNGSGGSSAPRSNADFGGLGLQKPGSKNNSKASGAKGGNRYDKKNSDELRRPNGKTVSNKDLQRPAKPVKKEPEEPQIRMITIPEVLTIKELADKMKIQPSVIVKKLFLAGKVVTVNQEDRL